MTSKHAIGNMNILITNDDGYQAKGIRILAGIMKKFGEVTVIAPKKHQSGMSMAVSMNKRALAYKELGCTDGVSMAYFDATPASCIKLALNTVFADNKPDVVISGINHGSNAASAACYSGTLGAAAEAALNDIPAIGVSMDTENPDADFSSVEKYLPEIFTDLMRTMNGKYGVYYNINFPPESVAVKGIRVASQGAGRWIREFIPWNAEAFGRLGIPDDVAEAAAREAGDGEKLYVLTGEFIDDDRNPADADHRYNGAGYITVVPMNINCTDTDECKRLREAGFDITF